MFHSHELSCDQLKVAWESIVGSSFADSASIIKSGARKNLLQVEEVG